MPRHRKPKEDAELNITSFMNLMIVLVPVLLMNMVFASTAILELKLPPGISNPDDDPKKNEQIELIIRKDHMMLNFPAGVAFAQYGKVDGKYEYNKLSTDLQKLKNYFVNQDKEKKDILLLAEADTDYQTIVSTMDAVRSYKAVLVTDVVDAELFPDISLGDAPETGGAALEPVEAETGEAETGVTQ